MPGILGGLFGSSPSVQSVPIGLQSQLDPTQRAAEAELINALSPSPSTVFPGYPGQLTAPESTLQTTSLAGLEAAAPGVIQNAAYGTPAALTGTSALANILTGGPQDLTGYYNTNVLTPLKQTFETTTLPDIMAASGGSAGGYQSSSQSKALSDASNNFMNTLAATQGQLAYETGQSDIRNKLAAAAEMPASVAAPFSILGNLLSAGGQQQAIAQQPLTAAYQEYIRQQGGQQTAMSDLLTLLGIPTQTAANQPVVQGGSQGVLGGLLGNSGFGSALGGALFGGGSGGGGIGGLLGSLFGGAGAGAAGAGVAGAAVGDATGGAASLIPLLIAAIA